MIEAIDSYYSYVKAQMATLKAVVYVNGNSVPQPFGGVSNARDWPQTQPTEGALYLLFLNATPLSDEATWAQNKYRFYLQWVWILIGTDIQPGQQGQNRSDRYRSNFQIIANLRQSNYPGFCIKNSYTATSQGAVVGTRVQSVFPRSEIEMVTWTPLRYMPKSDNQKSGIVYGAAAVELDAYDDVSTLVA